LAFNPEIVDVGFATPGKTTRAIAERCSFRGEHGGSGFAGARDHGSALTASIRTNVESFGEPWFLAYKVDWTQQFPALACAGVLMSAMPETENDPPAGFRHAGEPISTAGRPVTCLALFPGRPERTLGAGMVATCRSKRRTSVTRRAGSSGPTVRRPSVEPVERVARRAWLARADLVSAPSSPDWRHGWSC